jgi:hypothetical protein
MFRPSSSCPAEAQINDRAQAVSFAKGIWRGAPANPFVDEALQLDSFKDGWRQDQRVNGGGWLVGLGKGEPPTWGVSYSLEDATKQVAMFAQFTTCGELIDSGVMGYPNR